MESRLISSDQPKEWKKNSDEVNLGIRLYQLNFKIQNLYINHQSCSWMEDEAKADERSMNVIVQDLGNHIFRPFDKTILINVFIFYVWATATHTQTTKIEHRLRIGAMNAHLSNTTWCLCQHLALNMLNISKAKFLCLHIYFVINIFFVWTFD